MTTQVIKEHAKFKTKLDNITTAKKKRGGKSEPKPLCNLYLHSSSNSPLLHPIELLPISRIPMAVHFLTSAPSCTLSIGHGFNGPQCFPVKMSAYYTLYLAAVQAQNQLNVFFPPVPSVTPTFSPHVRFLFHATRLP